MTSLLALGQKKDVYQTLEHRLRVDRADSGTATGRPPSHSSKTVGFLKNKIK
jgi:hypothetical protein